MPPKSPGGGLINKKVTFNQKLLIMKHNLLFEKKRYSPKYVVKLAQKLRMEMTSTEKILWSKLCNKQIDGLRFRNQHPIDRYIMDFYCHEIKLVIEIDGGIHESQKEYDENRDHYLAANKYNVLRFNNMEIKHSLNEVLAKIRKCAIKIRNAKGT